VIPLGPGTGVNIVPPLGGKRPQPCGRGTAPGAVISNQAAVVCATYGQGAGRRRRHAAARCRAPRIGEFLPWTLTWSVWSVS
jgi:hypothetical protein